MKGTLGFLAGLGVGAAVMYMLDPDRGRTRRKLVGDQVTSMTHDAADAITGEAQDLRNRAQGVVAETRDRLTPSGPVSNEVLRERVRAAIGHAITHAGAVQVSAHDGVVTLSGPMLADEVDDLLRAASSVDGVKKVENHLDVHQQPDGIPSLQTA